MVQAPIIKNPKRTRINIGKESWYPYYAGFSGDFVSSLIKSLSLSKDTRILDPWNGSGTTTTLAYQLGFESSGCDLNPVMVIAAKAKVLNVAELPSLIPLANDIVAKARVADHSPIYEIEPLETWFSTSSATSFRQLERAVQQLLINTNKYISLKNATSVQNLSCIACFFYLTLFRTIRRVINRFYTSNPTWIKIPSPNHRLRTSLDSILSIFLEEVNVMADSAEAEKMIPNTQRLATFSVASSSSLPVKSSSTDLVITSPPYCTRIDYAVATLPELTILGFDLNTDFDNLRRQLIGASTVPKEMPAISEQWGTTCRQFLGKMLTHESKASATYYYKNHLQYFNQIFVSIGELNRVMKSGGACIVVVQDSYYKDIHNDLAQTFTEMFYNTGFYLTHRRDFVSETNIGGIHPGKKKYRNSHKPVESVLCFQK